MRFRSGGVGGGVVYTVCGDKTLILTGWTLAASAATSADVPSSAPSPYLDAALSMGVVRGGVVVLGGGLYH